MTQIDKSRFEWIGSDSARREGISRPSTTFWKDAIGRLMKNKVAVVCFFIIVLLILSCIVVPFFSPFESREQHLGEVNKGFMTVCTDSRYEGQHHVHYFGTDNLGRDLFLRAFEGGRVSLMIAFAAVFVNLIVGLIYVSCHHSAFLVPDHLKHGSTAQPACRSGDKQRGRFHFRAECAACLPGLPIVRQRAVNGHGFRCVLSIEGVFALDNTGAIGIAFDFCGVYQLFQ